MYIVKVHWAVYEVMLLTITKRENLNAALQYICDRFRQGGIEIPKETSKVSISRKQFSHTAKMVCANVLVPAKIEVNGEEVDALKIIAYANISRIAPEDGEEDKWIFLN